MKILFVNYAYVPQTGGLAYQMHNWALRLVKKGHEVTVVTSDTVEFKRVKLKREEYIDGVRVIRLRSYQFLPYKWLYFTPGIISFLFKEKADVVHVFSYLPTFITNVAPLVVKLKRTPLVLRPVFHPQRSMIYSGFLQKSLMFLYDKFIGILIQKWGDAVTVQTKAEGQFFTSHGIKNIYRIPMGDSFEQEKIEGVTPAELEEFKQKFGIRDEKISLTVGRVEKRKGQHILLEAFAKMHHLVPDSKLLIVGHDSGQRSPLEKMARALGIGEKIIFAGLVTDKELYASYEVCDIVVHPALMENFYQIAIEAWAHKKPIIMFDKVGEGVTPESGILVGYRDSNAMAEAMTRLFNDQDLARKMGQNGFKLLREVYNWDKIVTDIENVYLSLVPEKAE